jgi:hypothetical protein
VPYTSSMQHLAVLGGISEGRERLAGLHGRQQWDMKGAINTRRIRRVFLGAPWNGRRCNSRPGSLAYPWSLRSRLRHRSYLDGGSTWQETCIFMHSSFFSQFFFFWKSPLLRMPQNLITSHYCQFLYKIMLPSLVMSDYILHPDV